MADISLIQDVCMDDCDEGVFEQGDCSSGSPTEDESLSPLSQVQKYAQSEDIPDRQLVSRIVPHLFNTAPPDVLAEEIHTIMTIVKNIGEKDYVEELRADLLEQIPRMASEAVKCSDRVQSLKSVTSEYLLPVVVTNLGCSESAVDKAAHSTLIHLLKQGLITKPQAEVQVCPAVLALSNESHNTEVTMGAIKVFSASLAFQCLMYAFAHQLDVKCILYHITASFDERKSAYYAAEFLMSRMAHLLGRDVTERVFLKKISELCTSDLFYTRKICATYIGDFSVVVSKQQFEKVLLPCYISLCQDEIWGVRKASAEVIMFISSVCSPELRKTTLAPAFSKLLQDESRWVQMSAFQTLGAFISTFADPPITHTTYNSQGELIFVNNDGNEFLMNSPSQDVRFKQPPPLSFIKPCNEMGVSGDWSQFDDDEPKSKLELDEIEGTGDELKCVKVEEEFFDLDSTTINQDEDIKEIVETVKNAVLSYRNPEQEHGVIGDNLKNNNLSNENVISNIKSCDNLGNAISKLDDELKNLNLKNEPSTSSDNDSEVDKENVRLDKVINGESENEDDNLHLYNSYNYWYINPGMIVDLSVFEGSQLDRGKTDYNSQVVEDSLVEISFNETYCENDPNQGSESKEMLPSEPQQDIVPQVLLSHFVLMTDSSFSINIDNEMSYHCAYSLPAVALTLGTKNWSLLKHTVERLSIDMQYKVRRTVASSLHELAFILGQEIATEQLTPIFEGFIKDLDEVRIGVLKHLAFFLKIITPAKRLSYLPRLQEFLKTENEWNWRFRYELGKQLLAMVTMFKPVDSAKHIGLIAESLLHDVSAVQQIAIALVTELLRHISSKSGLNSLYLVRLVEKFAHSKKWKRRQTFALLCYSLLASKALPPEQFAAEIMPHLLDLSWDPVANVRLVVAKTIAQHIIPNDYFADPTNQHFDSLGTVIQRLQADKDRDVRQYAEVSNKPLSPPPELDYDID